MLDLYQQELLNASDVCSNCFGRLRREAVRPRSKGRPDETYSERVRWQTTVDDVPGPVVHEQQQLFCDCGADGPFTRIWTDHDVDLERLIELTEQAFRTLRAAGYQLDARQLGRRAVQEYHDRDGPVTFACRVDPDIDEVLRAAIASATAPHLSNSHERSVPVR
jgi:hypothetical protein